MAGVGGLGTTTSGGGGGLVPHDSLPGLPGADPHTQYLLLAGRATGQTAIGGTAVSEELALRGTSNANLGLIRAQSPIDFDDVTPANALSPYSVRDASTNAFTAGFIGGTFSDQRTVSFTNALFIYETLRGSPAITSLVNPAFAAFTLFQALPVLAGGTSTAHNPLQALILNAGPQIRSGTVAGTYTSPAAAGVNFAPQLVPLASGRTVAVTNITGLTCAPSFNTVAGSTAAFGTVRGLWARNIAVALFGSSAGVETLTAYHAVDVDALPFGGNVQKSALRSAITSATNARFLRNNGGAASTFGSGIVHLNDTTPIQFGGTLNGQDASIFWNAAASAFELFLANNSDSLRFSNPANTRFLIQGNAGIGASGDEFNFACSRFSMGAQTGAVGNQVGNFVAGTRTVAVGGEWSDFLLTQAANITVNAAMSLVAGWTVNAPSITLGTGSVTTGAALNVGGNPNQGTNRVGVRIISNPTGGGGVNAALWVTAGRSRFDGIVDINNADALGGGAAATLGTIGGSGPTTAAQAQWVQIEIAGVNHWIPVWT